MPTVAVAALVACTLVASPAWNTVPADTPAAVSVSGVATGYCVSTRAISLGATNQSPSPVWVGFEVQRRDEDGAWQVYQENIELDWRSKAFVNRLLKPRARREFVWRAKLAMQGHFEVGEYRLVASESASSADGGLLPPAARPIGPSFEIHACDDGAQK